MPSLSDDIGALRSKSNHLLQQLTSGRLKRLHPKLVAGRGNWSPAGEAFSVKGQASQEFRSFSFGLKRVGEENSRITIEFVRSQRGAWTASRIDIDAAAPKSFTWNGRRWVCRGSRSFMD